jgi:hypothetical protein
LGNNGYGSIDGVSGSNVYGTYYRDNVSHAFFYNGTSLTDIDYPGAQITVPRFFGNKWITGFYESENGGASFAYLTTRFAQNISFMQPAAQTFALNTTFTLAATAPGGTVTFTSSDPNVILISGTTATIKGVGSAIITANQAGSASYAPATPVTRTVSVIRGS